MPERELKFEIFPVKRKGKPTEYAWRLKAGNGKIIGDGSETYKSKARVIEMVNKIIGMAAGANTAEVDE